MLFQQLVKSENGLVAGFELSRGIFDLGLLNKLQAAQVGSITFQ